MGVPLRFPAAPLCDLSEIAAPRIVLPSFENMSPAEILACGVSPFDRAYDYADPLQFASDETVPFAALGVDDGIGVLAGLRVSAPR